MIPLFGAVLLALAASTGMLIGFIAGHVEICRRKPTWNT
jgi:hypothetical protein